MIAAKTVTHHRWSAEVDDNGDPERDDMGAIVESWEPYTVAVFGWQPWSSGDQEPGEGGRNPLITGITLLIPPSLTPHVCGRDRFTVDGRLFEVVGATADYSTGPFGWAPGGAVNLRRVDG